MTNPPKNPRFNGFSLPDGAWLPPELLYLLPFFSSLSQLKIILAVIYHQAQVGGSEPLTLDDIQRLTGIGGRSTVTQALTWLLGENKYQLRVLERIPVDRTYCYLTRLQMSPETGLINDRESCFRTHKSNESPVLGLSKARESESQLKDLIKDSLTDSLTDSDSDEINDLERRLILLRDLKAAGVYLKTAQDLAARFSEQRIREKMAYFPYALGMNFAEGPGWLVMAIKEDWPAPLGYVPPEQSIKQNGDDWKNEKGQIQKDLPPSVSVETVLEIPEYTGPQRVLRFWQAAREQLRMEMPKAAYDTWVRDAELVAYDGDAGEIVIGVHNSYARDWLDSRLTSTITRLMTGIMNQSVSVRFVVFGEEWSERA